MGVSFNFTWVCHSSLLKADLKDKKNALKRQRKCMKTTTIQN